MHIYTNGKNAKRNTMNFFYMGSCGVKSAQLACPFFTSTLPIETLRSNGSRDIKLLIRLCEATNPNALYKVRAMSGVDIRYFTSRTFHAKFYILGDRALVGSANLTDAGLNVNRELSLSIDSANEIFAELPAYFDELWSSAAVLTDDALEKFQIWHKHLPKGRDPEFDGVSPSTPETINVDTWNQSKERTYLESFRQFFVERLLPPYRELESIYIQSGDRHQLFRDLSRAYEIDRFLYWVKSKTTDEELSFLPILQGSALQQNILTHISEWKSLQTVPTDADRQKRILRLQKIARSQEALKTSSIDEITDALCGCAAFMENLRFTSGGLEPHLNAFKSENSIENIRDTITHLAFGDGDYVQRIYDCLYGKFKLARFGQNSVLELFGWINSEGIPPFNGRTKKALRYLGFNTPY